ncbi:GDSL esterase/lipase At5g41890 [Zingiber officinale]|nr:GDSL esterase/lipase At5g41890 [Zingiber officinale]
MASPFVALFLSLLLLQLLLLLPLFVLGLRLPAVRYPTIVLGDSLVDVGNNNYLFTISKANSPPYGIDFAPSGGQPTGRFTNGRTTSDLVVQALGKNSFPPPYLAGNNCSNAVQNGINYASGASGILDETGSLFVERIPLSMQVKYFEETRDYMERTLGKNATEFLKTAVFQIITGSNDILNYFEPSVYFFGDKKLAPTALQDILVSNLTLHLKRLHELGARKFLVIGVGPIGCIPYLRVIKLVKKGECLSAANTLIQGYNMKLIRAINKLNEDLGPESVFVYANIYDIFQDIIQDYHKYGFENPYDPCCGLSFPPLCLRVRDGNSSTILCKDRNKYVFWDAYHPTEAANIIIAKKLIAGDANATSFNLRRLYSG